MASYIYSDVDINLSKQTDGDVKKWTELDAVKSSLINILTTMKGERRMLPSFGSALQQYLFEPLDETLGEEIGQAIITELKYWDNRVVINSINVNVNHDANQYEITLDFSIITNMRDSDKISFVLRAI